MWQIIIGSYMDPSCNITFLLINNYLGYQQFWKKVCGFSIFLKKASGPPLSHFMRAFGFN